MLLAASSGSGFDEADEAALSSTGGLDGPEEEEAACWPRRLRRIDVIRNDCRKDWRARSTAERKSGA